MILLPVQVLICYGRCLCEVKLRLSRIFLPVHGSSLVHLVRALCILCCSIGTNTKSNMNCHPPNRPVSMNGPSIFILICSFIATANKYRTRAHTHTQATCIHLFALQNGDLLQSIIVVRLGQCDRVASFSV